MHFCHKRTQGLRRMVKNTAAIIQRYVKGKTSLRLKKNKWKESVGTEVANIPQPQRGVVAGLTWKNKKIYTLVFYDIRNNLNRTTGCLKYTFVKIIIFSVKKTSFIIFWCCYTNDLISDLRWQTITLLKHWLKHINMSFNLVIMITM